MTPEQLKITIKQPWFVRLVLILAGATAGAVTNEARQPTVQVTERIVERVVIPARPPINITHRCAFDDPLHLTINGMRYKIGNGAEVK